MIVFISYASANRSMVAGLAEVIEGFGHTVWFDQELSGGHRWWNDILNNIRECDLFVFALTPESLDSVPCKLEYTYADSLNKRILPVLMRDVNTALLPPVLSAIQFVDYRQTDAKSAIGLGRAFNLLPAAQPLPDPLPLEPEMPLSPLGRLKDKLDAPTLSYEEQAVLLSQMRDMLTRGENIQGVHELLERMKKRSDLFAAIDREITDLLKSIRGEISAATTRFTNSITQPASNSTNEAIQEKSLNIEQRQKWIYSSKTINYLKDFRTGNFLVLLFFGTLSFWGFIWRFGLVSIITLIAQPLTLTQFTSGWAWYQYIPGALVASSAVMVIFLVIRIGITRWVPLLKP